MFLLVVWRSSQFGPERSQVVFNEHYDRVAIKYDRKDFRGPFFGRHQKWGSEPMNNRPCSWLNQRSLGHDMKNQQWIPAVMSLPDSGQYLTFSILWISIAKQLAPITYRCCPSCGTKSDTPSGARLFCRRMAAWDLETSL